MHSMTCSELVQWDNDECGVRGEGGGVVVASVGDGAEVSSIGKGVVVTEGVLEVVSVVVPVGDGVV